VLLPPAKVVPLLLPLLGLAALAQPPTADLAPQPRQPEPAMPAGDVEVPLAPGRPTTLTFGAALDSAAVGRASRELGLQRVAVAEDMLTILLPPGLAEGTRLRFPVRFADGQQPALVHLVLIVDPANARAHVQVPRRPQTAQACHEALATSQALSAAKTAEAATLKSEVEELRERAGSLTELVAMGVLTDAGVRVIPVPARQWTRTQAVAVITAHLYVAHERMAVEVRVQVKRGEGLKLPWVPGPVKLTRNGTPVPALSVRWLEGPLATRGDEARLVVEWEAPTAHPDPDRPLPIYTLEMPEQGGTSTLRAPCLSNQKCGERGK
jgi:uncharacterized protein (TIGR02268 family)